MILLVSLGGRMVLLPLTRVTKVTISLEIRKGLATTVNGWEQRWHVWKVIYR